MSHPTAFRFHVGSVYWDVHLHVPSAFLVGISRHTFWHFDEPPGQRHRWRGLFLHLGPCYLEVCW